MKKQDSWTDERT